MTRSAQTQKKRQQRENSERREKLRGELGLSRELRSKQESRRGSYGKIDGQKKKDGSMLETGRKARDKPLHSKIQ